LKLFKIFAALLAASLLTVCLWYAQSRVFSKARAVSVFEIQVKQAPTFNKDKIKVGSYNVAHGRGDGADADNWTGKPRAEILAHLKAMADQISKASVDIMVLNEIDFSSTWSKNIDQARVLAQEAGFPYVLEQNNFDVSFPFRSYKFGNAVLSKFPLASSRFIDFPPNSVKEDIFAGNHDGVLCKANTPFGELRILPVHLEYRSEETRVKCVSIIMKIEAEEPSPFIALGDFNSSPAAYPAYPKHNKTAAGENAIDLLLKSGKLQTIKNTQAPQSDYTFPSAKPDRAIDWIFSSTNLLQSNKKVYVSKLSDHLMISADIVKRD